MTPRDWHESDKAMRLLAELDAAERMADRFCGLNWNDAAAALSDRAGDIQLDLAEIRDEAIDDFANASGAAPYSAKWWDAFKEAESEAAPVRQVCQQARDEGWGNSIFEEAA